MPPALVVIGPPGAPVRALGEQLARVRALALFDSDDEIARSTGRSVADLVIDDGEAAFRAAERRAVQHLLLTDGVLVLGGGAILDPDTNSELIDYREQGGTIVFVDTTVTQAAKTLGLNLSAPTPVVNPRAQWLHQYKTRRQCYQQLATSTVIADGRSITELAARVKACDEII